MLTGQRHTCSFTPYGHKPRPLAQPLVKSPAKPALWVRGNSNVIKIPSSPASYSVSFYTSNLIMAMGHLNQYASPVG
ncbi:hypothetical protein QQF64_002522 [Cirrhinus molitorella]|uniref:Uncharacterized protein n=1 Tax=Cirrhinus molitorella TaxID=172907 RepID=A0ABR3MQD2_9TELE